MSVFTSCLNKVGADTRGLLGGQGARARLPERRGWAGLAGRGPLWAAHSLLRCTGACRGPGPVTGETTGRWQRSAWYPHRMMINKRAGQRRGDRETVAGQSGRKAPQEASGKKRSWEQPGGQEQQGRRPRPAAGDQGRCVPQPWADEAGQGDGIVCRAARVHRGCLWPGQPQGGALSSRSPRAGLFPSDPQAQPLGP